MWTAISPRQDPDALCDKLLQIYEVQIQELEALKPALLSDGYCGLVRVTDEDLLSQPAGGGSRSMAGGTGAAGGAASAGASPSASEQQEARPVTPPGGASPSASPVKLVLQQLAAAGAGGGGASAQHLAQRGAELLAAGEAQQARHFLQAGLQCCPLNNIELAEELIGLLLEAEQRLGGSGAAGGSGASSSAAPRAGGGPVGEGGATVQRELRLAIEALARDEPRRALQHLQRAQATCPPDAALDLQRIRLWQRLITTRKHI